MFNHFSLIPTTYNKKKIKFNIQKQRVNSNLSKLL